MKLGVSLILGAACLFLGHSSAQQCMNMTVPVPVTARNVDLSGVALPENETAVVQSITSMISLKNQTVMMMSNNNSMVNVSDTYNISCYYCAPSMDNTNSTRNSTVQFLTHGIGFDHSYWDFPVGGGNYSYVQRALEEGYHTFSIDRLGTGQSSHANATTEVQLATEIEIVRQLTMALRNGSMMDTSFDKVIHVGHSYGSCITNGLVAKEPSASDGIVLTGYSHNTSFYNMAFAAMNIRAARLNNATRFAGSNATSGFNLSMGYFTWSDIYSNLQTFFYAPYFEQSVLEYDESIKQPFTIGEGMTIQMGQIAAPQYMGPVLVVTGARDFIYCGGDCYGLNLGNQSSIPQLSSNYFPKASKFMTYLPPNTGHAVNLHSTAPTTFTQVLKLLSQYF